MEISLSASVFDNGGVAYGRLVGGQMDPANQRLTHVLLQTGKGPRELLLPVEELLTVTVRPNTPILARDGAVGHLLRLGVRPHTGVVTHFVACVRHFFREKEITFDWNLIERADENGLYVKMDKKDVHALIS